MARRKSPENETIEQAEARKERESIANHATRSEKVSWERQYNNMQTIFNDELSPVENQIIELMIKKNEIYDRMVVIRQELVENCIHPFEMVVETEKKAGIQLYECKFCSRKLTQHDVTGKE